MKPLLRMQRLNSIIIVKITGLSLYSRQPFYFDSRNSTNRFSEKRPGYQGYFFLNTILHLELAKVKTAYYVCARIE